MEGGSEQVQHRPLRPLDVPVEQFLSMLRFENHGELDDLGLEIDSNTLKKAINCSHPILIKQTDKGL